MQRWNIDERLIPGGTRILFRDPSIWEEYKVYFSGANSASPDVPTLHTLGSSTNPSNQGQAALEAVFDEASNFRSQTDSPLSAALISAAKDAGGTVPNDILHEVQFFMTGEAVRREFARSGGPSYTPYLFLLKLFSEPSGW